MESTILKIAKKVIIPLIIVVPLSIAISLLIAEKIIRFTSPQITYSQAKNISLRVHQKSGFIPSELKKNQEIIHIGNTFEFTYPVKINSLGYRMEEFTLEKPKDEYRILMVGDSLTFGYGVEEKYAIPYQLKESLNEYFKKNNINKKVQVINAGFTSGKAPDTYYLYLKNKGFELNPDLIIVNYFLNNDISDLDDNVWVKIDDNGLPEKIESKTTEVVDDYTKLKREYQNWKFSAPIVKNSHLWILFATTLETRSPQTVTEIKKLLGVEDSIPLVQTLEVENCLFINDCTPKMEELYSRFNKVAKATIESAEERNIPIIISLLPANPQVKQVAQVLGQKTEREEESQELNFQPQKRIKQTFSELQVDVIDPLRYVADVNWQKNYFEVDGHPTADGYTRLSQAIYYYLVENWQIADKIR